jgi:hypothetical protein
VHVTTQRLFDAVSARHPLGSKTERSSILNEFEAIAGHYRKHLHPLIVQAADATLERMPAQRSIRRRRGYAVGALWEVSDRICSRA